MLNIKYKERVQLLLRIIPIVSSEECFAVHGGTAINLFIQNLPRYSVDIDLTYIPIEPRDKSLSNIKIALTNIKNKILLTIPGIIVKEVPNKLMCTLNGALVKVEVNDVKRGIIGETVTMPLCESAQETFGVFCKAKIVPLTQLYGGKISAALNRQHPRDLFDIKLMFDYIKDFSEIKYGFIFCLLGGDRPIFESLNPNLINQSEALENQFSGMTTISFSYAEYEQTRIALIQYINENLNEQDKQFLISFEEGNPTWDESVYAAFNNFPSVQWKQLNINKLKTQNPFKYKQVTDKIKILFRNQML